MSAEKSPVTYNINSPWRACVDCGKQGRLFSGGDFAPRCEDHAVREYKRNNLLAGMQVLRESPFRISSDTN